MDINLGAVEGVYVLKLLLINTKEGSLYLVFPITKNKTSPAISYKQAIILLPTDKTHSPTKNAA
jgi:hypothetical protein